MTIKTTPVFSCRRVDLSFNFTSLLAPCKRLMAPFAHFIKRVGKIAKAAINFVMSDAVYALLGYKAVSSGNPSPTFRDKVTLPS
jgi:hypothetical protein